MATKDDIIRLDTKIDKIDEKIERIGNEQQKDVLKLLELNSKKIDRLDAKFDILNHRVFEQEADIQLLKKAK